MEVFAAYEGELNIVKKIDKQIVKDIAFAKNLENNSVICLTNITLLQKNLALRIFIVHYF
tara:strand:+ start:363 stop:542 length:180 start_codon:yes stop_codon:yes gene_type:complete